MPAAAVMCPASGGARPMQRAAIAVIGTAAIYWAAGRVALWMAIPPGYATAVWPAAGLALICVLAWRRPAVAGVAIGSFAVNLATGFDGSSLGAVASSLVIAATIACGAAAQAALGAALIRRRVGFPNPLHDERAIVWFFALGGPIACLVNATIGVTTLRIAGAIAWSGVGFSWWTWWVGDTIGVLVFAPLALLALTHADPVWRRRRAIVGIPLAVGFAAVTLMFLRVSGWEQARLHTDFERRAVPVEAVLRSQLSRYEEVVASLASYFDASVEVDRGEFRSFCARALARSPAILALSWSPRVPAGERAELERRARADGVDGFEITELTEANELRIATPRAEYTPVLYIEPARGNRSVLGYDLASNGLRRDALERGARSGGLVATRRIDLIQGVEHSAPLPGVLLVVPVFASAAPHALTGYAIGAFQLQALVDSALRDIDHTGMSVVLIDRTAGDDDAALYPTRPNPGPAPGVARRISALTFGDRAWQLEIAPTAAQIASQRSWQAWTVLAAGLMFVGLLGVVLMITSGRAFRLHEAADRFRALVEASAQIVWTTDASGEVVEDSPSWRAFTGQSFIDWRGWGRLSAIHPDDLTAVGAHWRSAVTARTSVETEYRIRHAGGDWRWTAARAVPLAGPHGELRGWVMSNVDITDRVAAEAERETMLAELTRLNSELEARVQARTSELTAALREREVLLQEVHHRVKNNLQVISSLMNMQMRKLGAGTERAALEECQTRVEAIALIHEQLYQSRDYANVPFSEYTRTLVSNVFRTMGVSIGQVKLDLAIASVAVPVDKAIPCGLVVNELITNSLKHGFRDGRPGEIRVELDRDGDQIRLIVSDNGVGLPPGLDVRGSRTLGLRLVNTLVRQLRATLVVGPTSPARVAGPAGEPGGAGDAVGARFELTFGAEG
jgi:PAS domain S-box-containing protein